MKLYSVYDPSDDVHEFFTNKRDAIRYWRDDLGSPKVATVDLIDIGEPTLKVIIACLKGEGYVRSSKTVWPVT